MNYVLGKAGQREQQDKEQNRNGLIIGSEKQMNRHICCSSRSSKEKIIKDQAGGMNQGRSQEILSAMLRSLNFILWMGVELKLYPLRGGW